MRRSTIIRVISFGLFAMALGSRLFAQVPANLPVVRFTVFAPKPVADLSFMPRPNASPQKLQFQPTARSPRYEYRGNMPLRFTDASGAVVAEAMIPPSVRDAFLLFTAIEKADGKKDGLKYQIAVLDDSATRHGPGGLAIINLSGLALAGKVGAEKVTLKPGLNPTIAVAKTARVVFTTQFKNRTYQSYTGTVTLGRNERALLIFFPPFHAGALEVQSRLLLDQPPTPPSAMR